MGFPPGVQPSRCSASPKSRPGSRHTVDRLSPLPWALLPPPCARTAGLRSPSRALRGRWWRLRLFPRLAVGPRSPPCVCVGVCICVCICVCAPLPHLLASCLPSWPRGWASPPDPCSALLLLLPHLLPGDSPFSPHWGGFPPPPVVHLAFPSLLPVAGKERLRGGIILLNARVCLVLSPLLSLISPAVEPFHSPR